MISSLLRNDLPAYADVHSILLINSCSWDKALRIEEWIPTQFPNARVTHVLRDLYPDSYNGKDLRVSTGAVSIRSKIAFIRELRMHPYDLVIVCWTREENFLALKLLGLVVRGRRFLAFNENHDCFWLIRDNFPVVLKHARWRLLQRLQAPSSRRSILNFVTLVVLTPFGIAFVIARTAYYTAKKYMWIPSRAVRHQSEHRAD